MSKPGSPSGRFVCSCGKHIKVKAVDGNYTEFSPAGMMAECRWNGWVWEHMHSYPIGHVPMERRPDDEY